MERLSPKSVRQIKNRLPFSTGDIRRSILSSLLCYQEKREESIECAYALNQGHNLLRGGGGGGGGERKRKERGGGGEEKEKRKEKEVS